MQCACSAHAVHVHAHVHAHVMCMYARHACAGGTVRLKHAARYALPKLQDASARAGAQPSCIRGCTCLVVPVVGGGVMDRDVGADVPRRHRVCLYEWGDGFANVWMYGWRTSHSRNQLKLRCLAGNRRERRHAVPPLHPLRYHRRDQPHHRDACWPARLQKRHAGR